MAFIWSPVMYNDLIGKTHIVYNTPMSHISKHKKIAFMGIIIKAWPQFAVFNLQSILMIAKVKLI